MSGRGESRCEREGVSREEACDLSKDVADLRFVCVTFFFLTVILFIVGSSINNN